MKRSPYLLAFYLIVSLISTPFSGRSNAEAQLSPLKPANYYVSENAGANGNGSLKYPFSSITQAISYANYGDSVIVLPGTYRETVMMKEGVNVIGSGVQSTRILQDYQGNYIVHGAKDASLQGFTIEMPSSVGSVPAVITDNSNVKICDNRIIFTGSAPYQTSAVYCNDSSNAEILRNYIEGFNTGIRIISRGTAKIKNNIIHVYGTGIDMPGEHYSWAHFAEIINNTVIFEQGTGINCSVPGSIIKNNIVYGLDSASSTGISSELPDNPNNISYNNVWHCYRFFSNVTPGPGNLLADPLFVNSNLQNYHLKPDSRCIGKGDPATEFNDTDGSRNDIGAYGGPNPVKAYVSVFHVKALTLSKTPAFPGDTVLLRLCLDNPYGISKGSFSIKFDPAILTFLSADKAPALENFELMTSLSSGSLNVSFSGNSPINTAGTDLLVFRFAAAQNSAGAVSPVSLIDPSFSDEAFNPVYVQNISNGLVTIAGGSPSKHAIYVRNSPGTKEDGSWLYPFSTIQRGIDSAEYGDTIYAAPGEYQENIDMKDGVSVIGSGAAVTSIMNVKYKPPVEFFNISKGEFSGFTIKNGKSNPPAEQLIRLTNSSPGIFRNIFDGGESHVTGISLRGGSKPLVEGNYFISSGIRYTEKSAPAVRNNCMSDFIIVCDDSSTGIFTNNNIRINGFIVISNSSPVFRNNRITVTSGYECFRIYEASNVLISNNIIEDLGFYSQLKLIKVDNSSNVSIINNTIMGKDAAIAETGSTLKVMNNIITGCKTFGVSVSDPSMLQYNDVWGNAANYANNSPGPTDIQADPKFADEDYHLGQLSPCSNAGNPGIAFNDKNGSRNDIGAYGGPEADLNWPKNMNINSSCRIQIDSPHASVNDTVHLKINAYSVKNVSEIEFTISYDPECLYLLGASPSGLTQGFSAERTSFSLTSVKIALTGANPISGDNGSVAEILFLVKKAGSTQAHVKFESAIIKDSFRNLVTISEMTNGKVIINPTGVNESKNPAAAYYLANNYPNPFNPSTTIEYGIQKASRVKLKIFDVLGREIMTLVDKEQNTGRYRIPFNARSLASGVYIYSLEAGEFKASKKLLLIK